MLRGLWSLGPGFALSQIFPAAGPFAFSSLSLSGFLLILGLFRALLLITFPFPHRDRRPIPIFARMRHQLRRRLLLLLSILLDRPIRFHSLCPPYWFRQRRNRSVDIAAIIAGGRRIRVLALGLIIRFRSPEREGRDISRGDLGLLLLVLGKLPAHKGIQRGGGAEVLVQLGVFSCVRQGGL